LKTLSSVRIFNSQLKSHILSRYWNTARLGFFYKNALYEFTVIIIITKVTFI